MSKGIKKGLFLLLAVVAGGMVFWGIRSAILTHQRELMAEEIMINLNEEVFDVAVASTCDRDDMGMNSYIRWWRDDSDGNIYFLLPKAWQSDERAFWVFSNAEEITLDGEIIKNGDICDVEAGDYIMKVYDVEYPVTFMYSSSIATLFAETESGELDFIHADTENWEGAEYVLFDDKGNLNNYGHVAEFACRGNVTFKFVDGKKSYRMKLRDKSQILGMGEERDWLLLANAFDHTLSRNMIVHGMANELGLAYTPNLEYVDLYINGQYRGNYMISEQVEVGTDRINIRDLKDETALLNPGLDLSTCEQVVEDPDKLYSRKWFKIPTEPEDYSGGYLMEIEWSDRYGVEASGFITSRMQAVVVHNPKYATLNQIGYIADIYQDLEDAMYSENGYNEKTGKYFYEYIDMESFALKYMIEELTKNLDGAYTSCFFYKPQNDEKLYAGPVWDYDCSINTDMVTEEGFDLQNPEGLYMGVQKRDCDIWYGLFHNDYFKEYVDDMYDARFQKVVTDFSGRFIDENARHIADSAIMDDVLWKRLDAEGIEAKKELFYKYNSDLRAFLDSRLEWLGKEWSCKE